MIQLAFQVVGDTLRKLAKLEHSVREIPKNVIVTVDRITLDILRDSKTVEPRVPVDTGALQSTGHTVPATQERGVIHGELSYGGFSEQGRYVDYAVVVHEWVGRQYKRPGAGPKYVEAHVLLRKQEILQRLGASIKIA